MFRHVEIYNTCFGAYVADGCTAGGIYSRNLSRVIDLHAIQSITTKNVAVIFLVHELYFKNRVCLNCNVLTITPKNVMYVC